MDFGNLAKIHKTKAEYLDDFETPVYKEDLRTMKIKFIDADKGFYGKGKKLIPVLDKLATEYMAKGRKLTTRHAFYRLIGYDLIPNTESSYDSVGRIIDRAKQMGLLDWDAFEDRQRVVHGNLKEPYHGGYVVDIKNAIEREIKTCFCSDTWANQPNYCEVYSEKEALISIIGEAAEALDVVYLSCRGYNSGQTLYEAAERFKAKISQGKNCVLLYVGDHDASGEDMMRDVENRVNQRFRAESVEIKKIALTLEQARNYNLPPQPLKDTDTRSNSYEKTFKTRDCWECDALEPDVLYKLVYDGILEYYDDTIREKNLEEKEEYERAAWNRYKPVVDALDEILS
jgi:hypothetical protein